MSTTLDKLFELVEERKELTRQLDEIDKTLKLAWSKSNDWSRKDIDSLIASTSEKDMGYILECFESLRKLSTNLKDEVYHEEVNIS